MEHTLTPQRADADAVYCHTHASERSAGTCRTCLHEYCDHCLVYSFGRSKPPHCMTCALDFAGVRRSDSSSCKPD